MEILSKFISNYKIENIEKDEEINKAIILSLIEENINLTSTPFLCSFIECFLKNNINIILIGEKESLYFYSTILRKMGVNLLKKNNGFIFVDINNLYINLLSTDLPLEENYPETFNPVKKPEDEFMAFDKNYIDINNSNIFYQKIMNEIKNKIGLMKQKDKSKKIVILFDKVNDNSLDSINDLLKYCYQNDVCQVYSLNKEINSDKTVKFLEHLSDTLFVLKQNESGFSKDINGIINITIKMDQRDEIFSFRYSLRANEIKVFDHIEI